MSLRNLLNLFRFPRKSALKATPAKAFVAKESTLPSAARLPAEDVPPLKKVFASAPTPVVAKHPAKNRHNAARVLDPRGRKALVATASGVQMVFKVVKKEGSRIFLRRGNHPAAPVFTRLLAA